MTAEEERTEEERRRKQLNRLAKHLNRESKTDPLRNQLIELIEKESGGNEKMYAALIKGPGIRIRYDGSIFEGKKGSDELESLRAKIKNIEWEDLSGGRRTRRSRKSRRTRRSRKSRRTRR